MAADDTTWRGRWKRWRDCIAECWQRCLDLALVLWIVRVPLCAVIIGFLILDYTPQAQDLFTEFADGYVRIAVFLVLLTTVWAGTTHYAARLLLDTDMRFRAYADPHAWTYLGSFVRWVPRLLGLVPFAIVLIASERSIFNLPHIEDKDVIAAITRALRIFDVLVVAVAAAFLAYTVKRRDLMATSLVQRAEAKVSIVNELLQPLGLGGDGRRTAGGASRNRPALGPLLLFIVFLLSAAVIIFGADQTAEWLPRAFDRSGDPWRLATAADISVRTGAADKSAADCYVRGCGRRTIGDSRRQPFGPAHRCRCIAQTARRQVGDYAQPGARSLDEGE